MHKHLQGRNFKKKKENLLGQSKLGAHGGRTKTELKLTAGSVCIVSADIYWLSPKLH